MDMIGVWRGRREGGRERTYDDAVCGHRLVAGGGGVVVVVTETTVPTYLRHQEPEGVLEPFAA
jgi:hypothetical protein